jgi:hypothetical protein
VSFPLVPGDVYYLVVPADCGGEGATGSDSRGASRPLAAVGEACHGTP